MKNQTLFIWVILFSNLGAISSLRAEDESAIIDADRTCELKDLCVGSGYFSGFSGATVLRHPSLLSLQIKYSKGKEVSNLKGNVVTLWSHRYLQGDQGAHSGHQCFIAAVERAQNLQNVTSKDFELTRSDEENTVCTAFVEWTYRNATAKAVQTGKVTRETKDVFKVALQNNIATVLLPYEGDQRFHWNAYFGDEWLQPFSKKWLHIPDSWRK